MGRRPARVTRVGQVGGWGYSQYAWILCSYMYWGCPTHPPRTLRETVGTGRSTAMVPPAVRASSWGWQWLESVR